MSSTKGEKSKTEKQLLHLVIGGELKDFAKMEFIDLKAMDFVAMAVGLATEKQEKYAGRFLRDWLLPQWPWFALGTLFAAVTAACAFGYSYIIAMATDWLEASDQRVFMLAPLVIIGLVAVRAPAMYGQTQANNRGVQNDMVLVREASLRVATNLAKSTLTVIAAIAYMLMTDWLLTLVLLVIYPLAFYPVVRLGNRVRKSSRRAQEQAGELTSVLNEAFQGSRTVKAFQLEAYQKDRASKGFIERARLYMKVLRAKALVDPFLEFVGGLALAGLFAFAGWRAMSGDITVGELVGIIAAIGIASPEVRALGTLNSVVNEGLAAATRVYAVIDAPVHVADKAGAKDMGRAAGDVAFDGVSFSYPGASPALSGLSFEAKAGQTIAIVGPSGAGKSTVFSLLLRLYEASGGAVRVDGHDVRDVTMASLRRNLSIVSQDAFLFDVSVGENIALGKPGASMQEIEAAARAAACDFIEGLPSKWDTPAGEGGRNLSGGQRQRIALARALISDSPVLLLDEATSALDSESEARIQQALGALAGRRTMIIVAHRLATVRKADRIFVMTDGRCAEAGTHDELVAHGGVYAGLAAHQLS